MTDQTFKALIEIVNKASAPLRQINRDVAKTTAGFRTLGRSIAVLGEKAGLARLGEAMEGVRLRMEGVGRAVGGIIAPLAGLGEIAAIGGMVELARSAGEYGEQMALASQKTGLMVSALEPLHYLAKLTNIDATRLDNGLFRLNATIANAARGKNKDALALFQKLHISLRDGHKQVINAAAAFPKITDALSKTGNVAFRAAAMTTLFGGRIARDLVPIVNMGGDKVRELTANFTRLHGVLTDDGIKALVKSAEAWKNLGVAVDGLKITIGTALAPLLTPLIDKLTDWIALNRDLIASRISGWVRDLGRALSNVPWGDIWDGISGVGKAIAFCARMAGPFATGMGIALAVLSPILFPLAQVTAVFVRLGFAILGVELRLSMFSIVGAVAGLTRLATFAAVAAEAIGLQGLSSAFLALGVAIEATPVGWIIAGIAAVAGAAYLLYKYWKPITAFFGEVWKGIVAVFEWAWEKIKPIVEPILKITGLSAIGDLFSGGLNVFSSSGGPAPAIGGIGPGDGSPGYGPVIQRGGRGGAAQAGSFQATVDFKNVPPGVKVTTSRQGNVDLNTNVGKRFAPGY